MLAALFLTFLLSGVLYDCSLIKVNRLAACITLSVVGAALAVILWRWRKICTILQPMGSKG
jgi:hypothetical protein